MVQSDYWQMIFISFLSFFCPFAFPEFFFFFFKLEFIHNVISSFTLWLPVYIFCKALSLLTNFFTISTWLFSLKCVWIYFNKEWREFLFLHIVNVWVMYFVLFLVVDKFLKCEIYNVTGKSPTGMWHYSSLTCHVSERHNFDDAVFPRSGTHWPDVLSVLWQKSTSE